MSFDPNVPLPGDYLSDSQGDILNNFTVLNNSFSRNHIAYSINTDPGKHKFVELLNSDPVGTPPIPGLIAGQGTVYTKSIASESQLFYTPDNSTREYQLTRVLDAQFATFGKNVNNYTPEGGGSTGTDYDAGWTFLAGVSPGLVLMYGRYNAGSGMAASGTVLFPITIKDMFSLQITLICKSTGTTKETTISYTRATANSKKFEWNLDSAQSEYRGFYWQVIANLP